MGGLELIAGPNFSGRSAALRERAASRAPTFFIGPYAEAALSGLANCVADEIAIYRGGPPSEGLDFSALDSRAYADRKPQTLSGGEQVLLALHAYAQSPLRALAIDTALEQLDTGHRLQALAFMAGRAKRGDTIAAIDNRLDGSLEGWASTHFTRPADAFACDLDALADRLAPRAAPKIAIRDLHFRYPRREPIFRGASITLAPGCAYRLSGDNGVGKSTLLKLLVGVLAPAGGSLSLDGKLYAPWRDRNTTLALATQNPDHQWCGATLREDFARRRRALAGLIRDFPGDAEVEAAARLLGIDTFDVALYELPLAARKRLSWLWPFCGAFGWLVLDEPTIGQDPETRASLARALEHVCALGYGIVFVTHDDDFAMRIPHHVLTIANQTITLAPATARLPAE